MKALARLILPSASLAIATAEDSSRYESLREEVRQSIARGNAWLKTQQNPEGNWGDRDLPAFTALALNAIVRDPGFERSDQFPEPIE